MRDPIENPVLDIYETNVNGTTRLVEIWNDLGLKNILCMGFYNLIDSNNCQRKIYAKGLFGALSFHPLCLQHYKPPRQMSRSHEK